MFANNTQMHESIHTNSVILTLSANERTIFKSIISAQNIFICSKQQSILAELVAPVAAV